MRVMEVVCNFNWHFRLECKPLLVCACVASGERCQNQRFQKRQCVRAEPHRFHAHSGWGLKTLESVRKGQFVNEYVGDLIDEDECKRRIKQMHTDNMHDFYFLSLDQNRCVRASLGQNRCVRASLGSI